MTKPAPTKLKGRVVSVEDSKPTAYLEFQTKPLCGMCNEPLSPDHACNSYSKPVREGKKCKCLIFPEDWGLHKNICEIHSKPVREGKKCKHKNSCRCGTHHFCPSCGERVQWKEEGYWSDSYPSIRSCEKIEKISKPDLGGYDDSTMLLRSVYELTDKLNEIIEFLNKRND